VAVFTVRGTVLRDGDLLRGDDGRVVKIIAAAEATYRVDAPMRTCCCVAPSTSATVTPRRRGHEGGAGFLRIRKDPVLKEMLEGLGARVTEELAAFEPEAGAYGGGHHHHGDDHHHNPLAPIPLRQKIHRPSDKKEEG
jgi:urease accessory protein